VDGYVLDTERINQLDSTTQAELKPLVDQTEAKRREQIAAFRQNGPHVQIVEMAGTSHYCFAHRPDAVAHAVLAFLRPQ
jgi:pimeloyl-ACP methyl ester carboxylesterase